MRYVIRSVENHDFFIGPEGNGVYGVENAKVFRDVAHATGGAMDYALSRHTVHGAQGPEVWGWEIAPLAEYGRGDPALERVVRPVTTEPANTSCSGREIRDGETVSVGLNGPTVTVVAYLGNRAYRTVDRKGVTVDYDRNALWTEKDSTRGLKALR